MISIIQVKKLRLREEKQLALLIVNEFKRNTGDRLWGTWREVNETSSLGTMPSFPAIINLSHWPCHPNVWAETEPYD